MIYYTIEDFYSFQKKGNIVEDVICSAKKKGRDLTIDTLKIAGKEPVREIIIITPKDVKKSKQGLYQVSMSYNLNNVGFLSSRDFENLAYFNGKVVSRQQGLSLGPNESKTLTDNEVEVDVKDGQFLVRIDAFSKISEDDETNNEISATLQFRGFSADSPKVPALHIEMLRIAGKTPIQGRLQLAKNQAVSQKQGRYAFQVEYVIRNYGLADAVEFDNVFFLEGKSFFRQRAINLKSGESRLMELPVFFPPHDGKLTIKADGEGKYSKVAGCSQSIESLIYFKGFAENA